MKWLKIWTEDAKKTQETDQLYVRLLEDRDEDIWVVIVDKNGDAFDNNHILHLSKDMRAIMLHGLGQNQPMRTDIHGMPLHTTAWQHNMERGNNPAMQIMNLPQHIREAIANKLKESLNDQQMRFEQETKH